MHFVITSILVAVVHLALHVETWVRVGLLADDRHMVGGAVLRHRGDWSFGSMFVFDVPPDASSALYRPFTDLLFWIEQPFFGTAAFGYHAVSSALHCATAMVWYLLVRRWTGSIAASLATAVLFVGWPGHSEALHWIAARVDVQSVLFASLALLHVDAAAQRVGPARALFVAGASVCFVIAVGSKESGVLFLPLAVIVAFVRAPNCRTAAAMVAPVVVAVVAWLAWRARVLGTWGSGTEYGWRAERIGFATCVDWLWLLAAPVHRIHTPAIWVPVLAALHGALLLVGVASVRSPRARTALAIGGTLAAAGFVAGIGLQHLDLAALENVRYSYEPALGLCVVYGLAIAALPTRIRGPALALLVAAHAVVLDGNRQSWLRAADVYRRMEADVFDIARATQQPIRVVQAPGVHEGAFALLNGFTEFLFMQGTAPAGTNLRGQVSSTQEWEAVLGELAASAARHEDLANAYTVHWDDGALVPFHVDPQWPRQVAPGIEVAYAWIARTRPFVGSDAPVHVLVRSATACELSVRAREHREQWNGPVVRLPDGGSRAVALELPLPISLVPDAPVEVDLVVRVGDAEQVSHLGSTWPVAR